MQIICVPQEKGRRMFTLNPDNPNPALLNLLLHGALVTFDGGCYLKRVETDDGFYVEAGIGLSPHKTRFDLAEGELCLRKVAEWFATKRGEILKNLPPIDVAKGIEPTYKPEYTRTVREGVPVRTQVFAYDEILVTVTTGDRRCVTLSDKAGDTYSVTGLPVDVWMDITAFITETGPYAPGYVAPEGLDTKFICQTCQKTYRYGDAVEHFMTAGKIATTMPLCFCSGVCQSMYHKRTGRVYPPVGAEIPLGTAMDGPVYHGQVSPAYQQPGKRVESNVEEGNEAK